MARALRVSVERARIKENATQLRTGCCSWSWLTDVSHAAMLAISDGVHVSNRLAISNGIHISNSILCLVGFRARTQQIVAVRVIELRTAMAC